MFTSGKAAASWTFGSVALALSVLLALTLTALVITRQTRRVHQRRKILTVLSQESPDPYDSEDELLPREDTAVTPPAPASPASPRNEQGEAFPWAVQLSFLAVLKLQGVFKEQAIGQRQPRSGRPLQAQVANKSVCSIAGAAVSDTSMAAELSGNRWEEYIQGAKEAAGGEYICFNFGNAFLDRNCSCFQQEIEGQN